MSYLPQDTDLIKICNLEHRMRNPLPGNSSKPIDLPKPIVNALFYNSSHSSSPSSKENDPPKQSDSKSLKRKNEVDYDLPLNKIKPLGSGRRLFMDELAAGFENSIDIKNNRKITEFFKKGKVLNEPIVVTEKPFRKISFGDKSLGEDVEIKKNEKNLVKKISKNNCFNIGNLNVNEENLKLKEEIRKLNRKLVEKDNVLKGEELKSISLAEKNKSLLKTLQEFDNDASNKNISTQQLICKLLLECEKLRKQELKTHLNAQKQRLGEYISQRQGHKFIELWVDGYELRNLKEKLENLRSERELLEKTKKNLKIKKNGTLNPYCQNISFPRIDNKEKYFDSDHNADSNSICEPNIYDLKNRLSFQINILQKDEQLLLEDLRKLDQEKISFVFQSKRQFEEDHSRFARKDSENNLLPWPLLNSRYQLLSLLGKGGFSEVYKAFDLNSYNDVACKMHHLHQNWNEQTKTQYIKHALRENAIHQTLQHPNIVKSHEIIEIDPNTLCIILEYCEGPDLSLYLKQYKMLNEKDAKCILRQILSGLRYLHEHKKKIIHYDLKPQNILFHKGEIKISDFGLCKIIEDNATRLELTSQGVGTYWYLPPECFELGDSPPKISTKVDIWSLGVILYEMLFGEKPFGNNMSQEKILKENVILNSEGVKFPSKPNISSEAKEFINFCLMKDSEKRWDVVQAINSSFLNRK